MKVCAEPGRTMCTTASMSSTTTVAILDSAERAVGAFKHSKMSDFLQDLRVPWFDKLGGSMGRWAYAGSSIMGSQWPTRDSAESHHQNSNFLLLRRVDGSKQVRKLSSLLSCLFD